MREFTTDGEWNNAAGELSRIAFVVPVFAKQTEWAARRPYQHN
jgi:hypothetical protein